MCVNTPETSALIHSLLSGFMIVYNCGKGYIYLDPRSLSYKVILTQQLSASLLLQINNNTQLLKQHRVVVSEQGFICTCICSKKVYSS